MTELRKSVPPNVAAAVAKALEKLPADRFDSAAEFAEALADEKWAGEPTRLTPGGRPRPVVPAASPRARLDLRRAPRRGDGRPVLVPPPGTHGRTRVPLRHRSAVDLPISAQPLQPPGCRRTAARLVIPAVMNGKRQLYLVSLDEGVPRLLPAGDEPAGPAFSPDGRWLAFQSAGKLFKVALDGGTPIPLTAASGQGARVGRGRQHHLQRAITMPACGGSRPAAGRRIRSRRPTRREASWAISGPRSCPADERSSSRPSATRRSRPGSRPSPSRPGP